MLREMLVKLMDPEKRPPELGPPPGPPEDRRRGGGFGVFGLSRGSPVTVGV